MGSKTVNTYCGFWNTCLRSPEGFYLQNWRLQIQEIDIELKMAWNKIQHSSQLLQEFHSYGFQCGNSYIEIVGTPLYQQHLATVQESKELGLLLQQDRQAYTQYVNHAVDSFSEQHPRVTALGVAYNPYYPPYFELKTPNAISAWLATVEAAQKKMGECMTADSINASGSSYQGNTSGAVLTQADAIGAAKAGAGVGRYNFQGSEHRGRSRNVAQGEATSQSDPTARKRSAAPSLKIRRSSRVRSKQNPVSYAESNTSSVTSRDPSPVKEESSHSPVRSERSRSPGKTLSPAKSKTPELKRNSSTLNDIIVGWKKTVDEHDSEETISAYTSPEKKTMINETGQAEISPPVAPVRGTTLSSEAKRARFSGRAPLSEISRSVAPHDNDVRSQEYVVAGPSLPKVNYWTKTPSKRRIARSTRTAPQKKVFIDGELGQSAEDEKGRAQMERMHELRKKLGLQPTGAARKTYGLSRGQELDFNAGNPFSSKRKTSIPEASHHISELVQTGDYSAMPAAIQSYVSGLTRHVDINGRSVVLPGMNHNVYGSEPNISSTADWVPGVEAQREYAISTPIQRSSYLEERVPSMPQLPPPAITEETHTMSDPRKRSLPPSSPLTASSKRMRRSLGRDEGEMNVHGDQASPFKATGQNEQYDAESSHTKTLPVFPAPNLVPTAMMWIAPVDHDAANEHIAANYIDGTNLDIATNTTGVFGPGDENDLPVAPPLDAGEAVQDEAAQQVSDIDWNSMMTDEVFSEWLQTNISDI